MKNTRAKAPTKAELKAKLASIERERNTVLRQIYAGPQGPRLPLWMIISDYLTTQGGTQTMENIVQAMIDAGHELGKFPKRTVKLSIVSPSLRSVFDVSTITRKGVDVETVTLRTKVSQIHYAPETLRTTQAQPMNAVN